MRPLSSLRVMLAGAALAREERISFWEAEVSRVSSRVECLKPRVT